MRMVSLLVAGVGLVGLAAGCGGNPPRPLSPAGTAATDEAAAKDEAAAERAKLSPEDRTLVDAQEWCVVSPDERLGSMGPPVRLDVRGQPVFLCCKGCKRKAEADPEGTLRAAAELRAKKAASLR
jgi:hypothetical protein